MQILIDNCPNTYRLCDDNNQKFILLLRKGVYPYEYIDDLIKFNETKLTTKENFYSNLHLKNITDKDYEHAKMIYMFNLILYYFQMYLKLLEKHILNNMN